MSDELAVISRLQRLLGGTVKIAREVRSVPLAALDSAVLEVLRAAMAAGYGREFGVSWYGTGRFDVRAFGMRAKIAVRANAAVRYIAPVEGEALSSAQVAHHHLTGPNGGSGVEVVLAASDGGEVAIAETVTVQDFALYNRLDYGIPVPDARSGMLPPKLAQQLVNLARPAGHIHDPFCGNGRVVLEALRAGIPATGSDVVEAKVAAARENLRWFGTALSEGEAADLALVRANAERADERIWVADATDPGSLATLVAHGVSRCALVGEPYLGEPRTQPLSDDAQEAWAAPLADLYLRFLTTWKPAFTRKEPLVERAIIVFPSVALAGRKGQWFSLYDSLIDRVRALGYDAVVLGRYSRPQTLVRREIIRISGRDVSQI